MGDNDLDGLEEAFGDDFGFGFDDDAGDPNVKPVPAEIKEDISKRTPSSMTFTFEAQKQCMKTLQLQIMPTDGKDPATCFEAFSSKLPGNFNINIEEPQTATSVTVRVLEPQVVYTARLVATNPAGSTNGVPTDGIETPEAAPTEGDMSGWMVKGPDSKRGQTLGRRLSVKKRSMRVWCVLEGQVFEWFDQIGGKSLGKQELKSVKFVQGEDSSVDSTSISLTNNDGLTYSFSVESSDPNKSHHERTREWLLTLRKVHQDFASFGSTQGSAALF